VLWSSGKLEDGAQIREPFRKARPTVGLGGAMAIRHASCVLLSVVVNGETDNQWRGRTAKMGR
jgi:hypothetical protein